MAAEVKFSGKVPLKDGVTLGNIVNTYSEMIFDVDPVLPLETEGTFTAFEGEVVLIVSHGHLDYEVDGVMFTSFISDFEDFLTSVATQYASAGWIDYSGDDTETAYGPTERARALAVLEQRRAEMKEARRRFKAAVEVLATIT